MLYKQSTADWLQGFGGSGALIYNLLNPEHRTSLPKLLLPIVAAELGGLGGVAVVNSLLDRFHYKGPRLHHYLETKKLSKRLQPKALWNALPMLAMIAAGSWLGSYTGAKGIGELLSLPKTESGEKLTNTLVGAGLGGLAGAGLGWAGSTASAKLFDDPKKYLNVAKTKGRQLLSKKPETAQFSDSLNWTVPGALTGAASLGALSYFGS